MIRKVKDLFRKDFKEIINDLMILPGLGSRRLFEKFDILSGKYENIYNQVADISNSLESNSIGYDWGSWSGKIREAFKTNVPINFLANPLISFTMVFQRLSGGKDTQNRINLLQQIMNKGDLTNILEEDYIGRPVISNSQYKTSSNRVHHATHLGFYKKLMDGNFWDTKSIIEFGGGYGNMARIIRKMNPDVTYIIIDLPELLALQYIYLATLEDESKINIIKFDSPNTIKGNINLVSSELIYNEKVTISGESFISTWALSESPEYLQNFVISKNFFNAKRLLLASFIDENNKLFNIINFQNIKKEKVPFLDGAHEYWVK